MFALIEAVAVLERTPRALRGLLAGLPRGWLEADEGAGTFSAREIVAHLVHGEEDDWIPRLEMILEHGETRTFRPFDRFAHREWMADRPIEDLLDLFAERREESLRRLRALTGDEEILLERAGTHPTFGRVSARELLSAWVVHDLSHVAQAARVMAGRYGEEVGPWRAFLPVLDPARRGGGG